MNKMKKTEKNNFRLMKIKNISTYIKKYYEEKILFDEIGPKVKKRGYLKFKEFFKICMWKSRRPKQKYIKNKDKIEKISKEAFSEKDEVEKINVLCQLEGVRIPTASAILAVVFPKKYPIMDIRCLNMLQEFRFNIKNSHSSKGWLDYLTLMRNLARENKITPRKLDMALFAMHKEKLEKANFRNLY